MSRVVLFITAACAQVASIPQELDFFASLSQERPSTAAAVVTICWAMNKRFLAGILLGAIFLYLSLRNIRWEEVVLRLSGIEPLYLAPAIALLLIMQFVRALRWGLILQPLTRFDLPNLIVVTNLGFLGIVALPARLGELARAFLMASAKSLPLSSVLGTIVFERIMDSFVILLMGVFLLFFIPLPPWLKTPAIVFSTIALVLLILLSLMIIRKKRFLKYLVSFLGIFSGRLAGVVAGLTEGFIGGFNLVFQQRLFIAALSLSAAIWLINTLVIYLLLKGFGFQLPAVASFALNVILLLGLAIPAAPGFIGNWHYATVLGLAIFALPEVDSLSFALVHHFLVVGGLALLGIISLPFCRVSWQQLKDAGKKWQQP